MIHKKEFYFIRHGQTDHNAGIIRTYEHLDIPLNECGRQQALAVEKIISSLPIKTVCHSPLKRAQETKNIVTSNLVVVEHEIIDLGECSVSSWKEMTSLGTEVLVRASKPTKLFIEQVKNGINIALSQEGPVLIVSHGGVHWALCYLINAGHEWAIDNCVPVHFYPDDNGEWKAKKLL